jgi:hypothetical protein
MTPWQLRNFLIRDPPPHTIRITTAEGETQEIVPGKKSRVKIAETIAAVGPELVECLDANGKLLRAVRPDAEEAQTASAPEVPPVIAADPNAAMISHFANLLHRAYQHSTELAFNKLVELTERMGERSDAIEQRLERTEAAYRREQAARLEELYDRAEEAAAAAGANGPAAGKQAIIDSLVNGVVMGAMGRTPAAPGAAAPKPAPAAAPQNGKGAA